MKSCGVAPPGRVLRIRRSAWRSSIHEGGKAKNSVRDVTLGPTLVGILWEHIEAERSERGFLLENSLGMRSTSMRLQVTSSGQLFKRLA